MLAVTARRLGRSMLARSFAAYQDSNHCHHHRRMLRPGVGAVLRHDLGPCRCRFGCRDEPATDSLSPPAIRAAAQFDVEAEPVPPTLRTT
jgi:hypothetical protein